MSKPHDTPLNIGPLAPLAASKPGRIALQIVRWAVPVVAPLASLNHSRRGLMAHLAQGE